MIRFIWKAATRTAARQSGTDINRAKSKTSRNIQRAPIPSPPKEIAHMNTIAHAPKAAPHASSPVLLAERLFPPVALASPSPLDAEFVKRHAQAIENRAVGGAGIQCRHALRELVELALPALVSLAVDRAQAEAVAPEAFLARLAAHYRTQAAQMRAEQAQADARRKSFLARTEPLRAEVSRRLTSATNELSVLVNRLHIAVEAPKQNAYQKLLDAGLNAEDIQKLGRVDPADTAAQQQEKTRARVAVLHRELAALKAFGDDHDPAQLAEIDGFADLIATQRALESLPL